MKTKMTFVLIAAVGCAILLGLNAEAKKPTSQNTVTAVATASPTIGSLEPISANSGSTINFEKSTTELQPLPACDGCRNNKPTSIEERFENSQPVSVRAKRR